ncbi:hypothetical protein GCM10022240_26110 [Microbacterium kribbense]|uniref:Integrase catalytic domain-containing protein n=1 Tax=Microbacterium kribbense TaxID=433645 RepID=A0ABP7GUL9_9MICO
MIHPPKRSGTKPRANHSWAHWFNENRLHSSIGDLTPVEKENEYYRENNPQRQPALGELALHETRALRREWRSALP